MSGNVNSTLINFTGSLIKVYILFKTWLSVMKKHLTQYMQSDLDKGIPPRKHSNIM